ncbi:MAG: hypothetical protein EAZ27_13525 [Cytophagales bacterium]|nr:MAG: hypothetical protein EAZ27_13525 [Cytophagales bacterium]
MTHCIAVFDIGKTNKKIVLFDFDFNIIYDKQTTFEEIKDDEGDACEDLHALTVWMQETWKHLESKTEFDIKALNFTTYGASFVHINEKGVPVCALYNYLKPLPKVIEEKFHQKYGSKMDFAIQTASPSLGMLNSGLQIYWLKYAHPTTFAKIKNSLHFPQYCSYLFTKNLATEFTSIGCHTGLWDMHKNNYHSFIIHENILPLLPKIKNEHLNGTTTFRNKEIPVGTGLHDSSAALIPYLKTIKEKFILLSTGTWCITINPFAKQNFTQGELINDALNYMTFEGKQVKASRLFSGNFHENYTKRLSSHFFKAKDYFKIIKYDKLTINFVEPFPMLLQDRFNPDEYFDATDLDNYTSYEEAYHKLILDLVDYQIDAIMIASENLNGIETLYVDGGFSKNPIFMALLKEKLPQIKVTAHEISQGTSLGGAMVMKQYVA